MKIKYNFIIREIGNEFMVVPYGKENNFKGMIKINSTGKFLWELFKEDITKEDAVKRLMEEYEIDEATANSNIEMFIEKLSNAGIME